MELKNAAAVCLISLCSATLVVLIARSLDVQTASQLEPQLTRIADELRSIRRQAPVHPADAEPENLGDTLIVYYFHSSTRCDNCRAIESQTKKTLDTAFASQLARGTIVWKVLNYEKPSGAVLALKFEVKDPVVVLAKMKDDRVQTWERLDKCMAFVAMGDKPAFTKYISGAIERMLSSGASRRPPHHRRRSRRFPFPTPTAPPRRKRRRFRFRKSKAL